MRPFLRRPGTLFLEPARGQSRLPDRVLVPSGDRQTTTEAGKIASGNCLDPTESADETS
ncbi:MAG: hypothetical protein HFE94_02295 [Acutalibacter sp.]|nr:hypothetical protein [Acutalibacter sp.]